MAASIPLRSDFDRLHREARDAKNTARASRLLARETIDDGAYFWISKRGERPFRPHLGKLRVPQRTAVVGKSARNEGDLWTPRRPAMAAGRTTSVPSRRTPLPSKCSGRRRKNVALPAA